MDPASGSAMTPAVQRLASIPTPVLADALVRLGLPARAAPAGLVGPDDAGVAGRVLPVRHSGSVDVFLEALEHAQPGDVLVIDNGGRRDEACIGDLVVHEAIGAGLAGIVIWGLHRDAAEIAALGLPVWSYGVLPYGPLETRWAPDDRLRVARFGEVTVTSVDVVAVDGNGAVFLPTSSIGEVTAAAEAIRDLEARQIERLRSGTSLREQLDLAGFLRDRAANPGRTFRAHLRDLGRAIEE